MTHSNSKLVFLHDTLPFFLLGSFIVFVFVIATTSIETVPRDFPFGFTKSLPLQYWIAVALTLILLSTAIIIHANTSIWIAAVFLIALVPGIGYWSHTYPKDVLTLISAEWITRSGFFHFGDNVFLNFPGAVILFSSISVVTNTTPTNVVMAFGLIYNYILLVLSFLFFRRLGMDKNSALFGALVAILSFYFQGALILTSLLGFIFYIAVLGLILAPYSNRIVNNLLLMIFFAGMIISHAYTPFPTITAIATILIGWKILHLILRKSRLEELLGDPPLAGHSILTPLLLILIIYWSYFAALIFSWGLALLMSTNFLAFFHGAISPILSPQTVYQRSYSRIAALYAPPLFFAFGIYLLSTHDRRKPQLLLWLLGLGGPLLFVVSGYSYEFLARSFAFATLPLGYATARLFSSNRKLRVAAVTVLLITVCLHLPAHYGQDSFWMVQNSTIQGAKFFVAHSFSNVSLNSPLRQLREHYYIDIYRSSPSLERGPGSYFLSNYQAESLVLYMNGSDALEKLVQELRSNQNDLVYSDGSFKAYLKQH
jgi:hypothetical protein